MIGVAVGGALLVLAVLVVLILELEKSDRRALECRKAYDDMLRAFVKAEADLAIAKMVHGGEIARLTRELQQHDRT